MSDFINFQDNSAIISDISTSDVLSGVINDIKMPDVSVIATSDVLSNISQDKAVNKNIKCNSSQESLNLDYSFQNKDIHISPYCYDNKAYIRNSKFNKREINFGNINKNKKELRQIQDELGNMNPVSETTQIQHKFMKKHNNLLKLIIFSLCILIFSFFCIVIFLFLKNYRHSK